jgi:hypothetical protein
LPFKAIKGEGKQKKMRDFLREKKPLKEKKH